MNEQNAEIQKATPTAGLTGGGTFANLANFEAAQRMAKVFAGSSLVPDTYKGDAHLGDCMIAMEMANRLDANILSVMQNMYIVHGRPSWSSQFLISCINASGRFSPLRYVMEGAEGGMERTCYAWANDHSGERLEGPVVSMEMAKLEGWLDKNGSKWKTMPELMLRYRAATFFARLYAPDITMGMQTAEEARDVIDVEYTESTAPAMQEPKAKAIKAPAAKVTPDPEPEGQPEPPKPPSVTDPAPKRRGRPAGSKNKPKEETPPPTAAEAGEAAEVIEKALGEHAPISPKAPSGEDLIGELAQLVAMAEPGVVGKAKRALGIDDELACWELQEIEAQQLWTALQG